VILESSCLTEPAAALRGLAKTGSPDFSRSLLRRLKSSLVMITSPRTSMLSGTLASLEPQGDRSNGPQVDGHIFPDRAVPPGGAEDQDPVLVNELDGKPVEFGLHGVLQPLFPETGEFQNPAVEIQELRC
jgi:hypothetical protein